MTNINEENTNIDFPEYPGYIKVTPKEEFIFAIQRLVAPFTFVAKLNKGKSLKQAFRELVDRQEYIKARRRDKSIEGRHKKKSTPTI